MRSTPPRKRIIRPVELTLVSDGVADVNQVW
jgi:hypothetical protein